MKKTLFSCIILGFLSFSCAVNQEIILNSDGSGRVESEVFLEDFFLITLQNLTDLDQSGSGGESRLEPGSIANELRQNPYFSDITVSSQKEGQYRGDLKFNHIEDLLKGPNGFRSPHNIISYSSLESGVQTLDIRINDENFYQVFQLFPMLQDPGFQYFLPESEISRAEYEEMLFFIFEDTVDIPETTLRSLIKTASLNLLITVDGDIIEQRGGIKMNSRTIKFSLPLVELLLHKNEIHYSLRYKSR